ncbi:LicD family protein [Latilactobacillus sakei]
MQEISVNEEKKLIVEILAYIDRIATQNNIHYSLGGGTLLGAVRHKGFIPWDDDADIMLAREEYEKLISILKEKDEYKLLVNDYNHPNTENEWNPSLYAKLVDKRTFGVSCNHEQEGFGVFVDIFPIDGLPKDKNERESFKKDILNAMKIAQESSLKYYWLSTSRNKTILKKVYLFPRFLKNRLQGPMKMKLIRINKKMQTYSVAQSELIGWLGTMYDEAYPKVLFDSYDYIDFEGVKLSVIRNYDLYLKDLYGNYMELPPENKRINHAFYKFMWRNK